MNYAEALTSEKLLEQSFDIIVEWVFEHGGLVQFPRVVHYIGKQNGDSGWQDSCQNYLINRIITSNHMKKEDYYLYSCYVDSSRWYLDIDEWRMLAYKQRLIPTIPINYDNNLNTIGKSEILSVADLTVSFFATAGREPKDYNLITFEELTKYLTELKGGDYKVIQQIAEAVEQPKLTFWQTLKNSFYG